MNHLSVRYSIAKTGLKLSGYKKIFGLPQDELVKKAEGYNKNRDFRLPRDRKFIYGDVPVCGGKYHCLTIQQSRTRTKRAILFFFGGGMLIGPEYVCITMRKGDRCPCLRGSLPAPRAAVPAANRSL